MTQEDDLATVREMAQRAIEVATRAQEDAETALGLIPTPSVIALPAARDKHLHTTIRGRPAEGQVPSAGQVWAWSEVNRRWELDSPGIPGAHAHTGPAHTFTDFSNEHHAQVHSHASHTGVDMDDHHPAAHTITSHTNVSTATGPQLDAVTDGGEVDIEHTHKLTTYITIGSESGDGISYTV